MSQKAQQKKISSKNNDKNDKVPSGLPMQDWPSLNQGGFVDEPVIDRKIVQTLKSIPTGDKMLVLAFMEALYNPGLPEDPPEYYSTREDKSENIIEFLERVYFSRGVKELPRPYLRQNDPKAYQALNNWLKKHKLPQHLQMPKRRQELDERMSQLISEFPDTSKTVDEMARVIAAMKLRAIPA